MPVTVAEFCCHMQHPGSWLAAFEGNRTSSLEEYQRLTKPLEGSGVKESPQHFLWGRGVGQ